MLSLELINKRITDYQQDVYADDTTPAKVDILYWATQNKTIKTKHEIENKIKRLTEELCGIYNTNDLRYRSNIAKINELKFLIK